MSNLSEKEKYAIKELTEIKELVEEDLQYAHYEVTATLNKIDLKSLVIVLNLIEKQQKELEEQNKYIKNHIYYKEFVELNYIPKSKVRELQNKYKNKIEKLESKRIWNEPVDTINKNRYTNYYNAYEELLQEGDDK